MHVRLEWHGFALPYCFMKGLSERLVLVAAVPIKVKQHIVGRGSQLLYPCWQLQAVPISGVQDVTMSTG